LSKRQIDAPVYNNIIYLTVAVIIFLLTDAHFFALIDRDTYQRIFAMFLAFSGLVLALRAVSLPLH